VITTIAFLELEEPRNWSYVATKRVEVGISLHRTTGSSVSRTTRKGATSGGKAQVYTQPGERGDYGILSYGKDGRPGGSGENADISNH
jgi:hypothetical protein